MSEISTRYNPQDIESRWYPHWENKGYFHSEPDDREPFSIVIPPPNVTGVLHMGHMLNNTIQDILIRKARLEGKNACWVPGTDHASIATEAKVVQMLRQRGITKGSISREEFMEYAYEWKDKYGGIILEQLKKLGASCDWERTRFTMEPSLYQAVIKVFVDLYNKGRIYRGLRMTNWDPVAKTVLSNEEVIYQAESSKLYHLQYLIEGTEDQYLVIATQRPETIMGDTAVAVHPDDPRYAHLKGKRVLIPLINKAIPVIFDDYVDREFGTGALKVTPAHDQNDYDIGQRHHLETVDILHEDGRLNENAQILVGEDRFDARKKIHKLLEASGHLLKTEDYTTNIGRSERTNTVVEPRLTEQWFLDMKQFARMALDAVRSGEIKFYPEHFFNMYQSWLHEDNIRDWCISRQLWWGQRIPAWYYQNEVFVAESAEDALDQARYATGNPDLQISDLKQDEDVVDTWFSSWLWPITVFDGFERQDELAYYYPTNVLVTGWDIIFFWVARMVMSGYEYSAELLGLDVALDKGRMPFKEVFFTGMVRDNQRRKMSKSLGNSPDSLALIERYGADGVRFGILSSTSAGNDIIFDAPFDPATKEVLSESKLCEQGRNFCNKMWNALRLIKGWEQAESTGPPEEQQLRDLAVHWMEHRLQQVVLSLQDHFEEYRLSDAVMALYSFIWDDFCSWYLEMIKPAYGQPIDRNTYERTIGFYETMMTLLHPFMPFVTEEIWHQLRERQNGEDCMVSHWPKAHRYDAAFLKQMEKAKEAVAKIRDARNLNQVKPKETPALLVEKGTGAEALYGRPGILEMVIKLTNAGSLDFTEGEVTNAVSFLSGTEKYYLIIEREIDVEAERDRIQKELDYYKGFTVSVEKKLSNERFVQNAPADVVDKERQKLADGLARIKILEENLARLN